MSNVPEPPEPIEPLPRAFAWDSSDDGWIERLRSAEASGPLGSIGPYVDVREIARGGQGVVYRARRVDSDRPIALKRLIAGSLATATARRRFEREVEAISALDHDGIVSILGVEVVDGQPLLAMEWIEGVPIDRWARGTDAHRPDLEARLRLFRRVCDAIQHAHQHGVIHRDLKPSNILVDGDDRPHVLDFGLAKLVGDERYGTATTDTVGTPAYASPEQVRGNGVRVDTRTDVYSLGVVLFEIVTGRLPYPDSASYPELLRAIDSVEPPRPSSIARGLDRDLDVIVLKALRKEREARYASVDALASDVECYLAGYPVSAHPPGAIYRLRKLARRHKTKVAVAAVAAALTAAFGFHAIVEARERSSELEQREKAFAFLRPFISYASTSQAGARATILGAVLRELPKIDATFSAMPIAEAIVCEEFGGILLEHGRYTEAERQLDRHVELLRLRAEPRDELLARALSRLATARARRGKFADAERGYREALAVHAAAGGARMDGALEARSELALLLQRVGRLHDAEDVVRGERDESDEQDARILAARAELETERCQFDVAEEDYRRALAAAGTDEALRAGVLHAFGVLLVQRGDLAGAEKCLSTALEIRQRVLEPEHADVGVTLAALGSMHAVAGESALAETLYRRALEIQLARPTGDPFELAGSSVGLATILAEHEDFAGARAAFERALDVLRDRVGERHAAFVVAETNLSRVLHELGRFDEADVMLRHALELAREIYGENHKEVAMCLNGLAVQAYARHESDDAISLCDRALSIQRGLYPYGHPYMVVVLNNRAEFAVDALDPEAGAYLREALEMARRILPAYHTDLAITLGNLGHYVSRVEMKPEQGEPLLREALEILRLRYADTGCLVARAEGRLGGCLQARGRYDEAGAMLRSAWLKATVARGEDDPFAVIGLLALASHEYRFGDRDEAEVLLRRGLAHAPKVFGDAHERTLKSQLALGQLLLATGRAGEAQPLFELARQRCRATFGESDAVTVLLSIGLATADVELEKFAEAEPLIVETLGVMHASHAGETERIEQLERQLEDVRAHLQK